MAALDPHRSYEAIDEADLRRLAQFMHAWLDHLFATSEKWQVYRGRLLAICLVQGAALHYVDGTTGIKDFDVYAFFARHHGRPYPDSLFRPGLHRDFGPSRFGRRTDADGRARWPSFAGRNVDLYTEALETSPGGDYVAALRRRLSERPTKKWRFLAAKAVVRIEPEPVAVLWPLR
jgi:hypothetical protein